MIREGERRTPGGMDNDDDGQSVILYSTIACYVYEKRGRTLGLRGRSKVWMVPEGREY